MQNQDYPLSFQVADRTSIGGQGRYRRLITIDLALSVVAALVGALSSLAPKSVAPVFAVLAVLLFIGAIIAKFLGLQLRDDKSWFDGRAVAETIKSSAWHYMMRVKPFDVDETCDKALVDEINEARQARPGLRYEFGDIATGPQITKKMREVRQLRLQERREFYLVNRLYDQVEWYRTKAESNRRVANRWLAASLGSQLIALVLIVARLSFPLQGLDFVGLFAALSSAFTAWSQLGRHDELSKNYALANQELQQFADLAREIEDEEALSRTVQDGENAISREHKMWVAKRG